MLTVAAELCRRARDATWTTLAARTEI